MRRSKTLAKLRHGSPARLCNLGHFIPSFIKQAADNGYDCIWLDAEHRTFQDRELQTLLAYFRCFDIDCMLRPPTLEKTRLYRYLEDGATGLMIPHVSTPEKARQLVEATKFPPLGDRGLDGVGFDASFTQSADFVDQANEETFLTVQIETPLAVDNAEAIAAIEGVDILFVGPADLSLRIDRCNTDWTLDSAMRQVATAAAQHGKAWGAPAGSPEQVRKLHDLGAQFIAYGGEFEAILTMLQNCSRDLDSIFGKR